jgi:hypothetical protein
MECRAWQVPEDSVVVPAIGRVRLTPTSHSNEHLHPSIYIVVIKCKILMHISVTGVINL